MRPIILAIETSCDETAAAVYQDTIGIRSNVLHTQIELHSQFGGVIPELASRSHIEKINTIVDQALQSAQCHINDIDAVAVTHKPGLPGSLLVGLSFAKGLAWSLGKKLIGVDHLEGHVFSLFLEHTMPFPFICLSASGGHTALYIVYDFGNFKLIGSTLDDAAGEAFDKIAKLIGLGYPGGPLIEQMAGKVGFKDFFKYPRSTGQVFDFSFSGLKTAVLYDLMARGWYDATSKMAISEMTYQQKAEVASSLLVSIADIFEKKIEKAISAYPFIRAIGFVGGVACNRYISERLAASAKRHQLFYARPKSSFCTDNAAMIGLVASYRYMRGLTDDYSLDIG